MELIYNKFFLNILGKKNKINNDLPSDISEKSNLKCDNLLVNIKKENNFDNDLSGCGSEEMPSPISSIDSIDSDSSNDNDKKVKIKNKNEIRISEITEMTETTEKNNTDESGVSDTQYTSYTEEINSNKSENKANSSDNEILDKKMTIESVIEKKYLTSIILNKKKYYEEIKELNSHNYRILELSVLKNSYSQVISCLSSGDVLYKKDENYDIVRICSNKNCNERCEKKYCNKSGLYYSIWNNIRGVKTIYNLLLKLIIIYPQFRDKCKCCEDINIKKYLEKLEENFNSNLFDYEETNLDKLELKINYLINKFTSVVGIMTCQCKFLNKYYEFYQDNYLNFRKTLKIYKRTIPYVIIMLKAYFNIKENHEELSLIKEVRCMHEDIRYNNMTYCLKKKYNNLDRRKVVEIINNLDLVNIWSMESFEISLLLFNEQSLETFRHVLYKYKKELNIVELFNKIYNKKNNILNLNYIINKKNLINSIFSTLKNKKTFEIEQGKQIINAIILQLTHQNKKYKDIQNRLNEMMIQYLIECYNYEHIRLGIEFFKNIKDLDNKIFISKINNIIDYNKYSIINTFPTILNKNSKYGDLLKYIFDKILSSHTNYQIKISYLKIINKNRINIINYDFINKLIEIDEGEKIVLELPQYNQKDNMQNYFLDIPNYKNINHINAIIKKCIANRRVNILNYFLSEINCKIKENEINPYTLYFTNVDNYKKENEYIELLKVITKYKYNINSYVSFDECSHKNNLNFLHYCVKHKLNSSARILIHKSININIICENKNFLFYCIDNKNHIVFGEIINKNDSLINETFENIKIHTYLFLKKELEENVLMRFLIKILSKNNYNINYYDKNNIHIGFQILESKLDKRNKVLLFKLILEKIDPLIIKNNVPLLMCSVVLDEYEISYMLLNKVFKNNNIKKSLNFNSYLDYELLNDNININFVPLILKYIKENAILNKINIDKIYLESDAYIENILVMILEIVICVVFYKNKMNITQYKLITNKISNTDSYEELYKKLDDEKPQYEQNIKSNTNGYMEISIDTDENNIKNKVNKNIWKNPQHELKKKQNSNTSNIKFNFKSETIELSDLSDLSEIEESNICFDNKISHNNI
jgi:hypothetical protein